MVCLLCSINLLLFTLKHSGLFGHVLFSLTYQIIIGQNRKGEIKPTINQLASSIVTGKTVFECDPADSSCALEYNVLSSRRFFFLMSKLSEGRKKVGHQCMSCSLGGHRVP